MSKEEKIIKYYRCAVYTRKSHEDGLELEFNSLDAQREACENYIASQKGNNWICLPDHFDDGGYSGGNTNRPGLKQLIEQIKDGKIDIVVIYKIDRLTRSLTDFGELQEFFEQHNVSFVSVTQDINTSTSAGRMMLNILMTFAQYEREIIADRVRDKILAAKKRGKNCGGYPYLGYDSDPETKKLQINPQEAKTIRFIYQKYLEVGSAKEVAQILEKQGFRGKVWTTKKGVVHDGQKINNHMIYRILRSPIYVGRVPHKKTSYPGEHEAIIDQATWDKVQETLKVNMNHTAGRQSDKLHPFTGLVTCGHCTGAMTLSHTVKYKNKKYHYYICNEDTKRNIKICPTPRIPASEFEKLILLQLEILLRTPTMLAKIDSRLDENGKNSALRKKMAEKAVQNLQKLWEVMIPYERYTLIHNIVDEIKVYSDHVRIEFNRDGIIKLLTEAGVKEYESNQNR